MSKARAIDSDWIHSVVQWQDAPLIDAVAALQSGDREPNLANGRGTAHLTRARGPCVGDFFRMVRPMVGPAADYRETRVRFLDHPPV